MAFRHLSTASSLSRIMAVSSPLTHHTQPRCSGEPAPCLRSPSRRQGRRVRQMPRGGRSKTSLPPSPQPGRVQKDGGEAGDPQICAESAAQGGLRTRRVPSMAVVSEQSPHCALEAEEPPSTGAKRRATPNHGPPADSKARLPPSPPGSPLDGKDEGPGLLSGVNTHAPAHEANQLTEESPLSVNFVEIGRLGSRQAHLSDLNHRKAPAKTIEDHFGSSVVCVRLHNSECFLHSS
mmetsp:Transcript_16938/g.40396  ORF Transcript_16938/g.40396 Transcript_16938/m.40396 type:complete len:235 (-) Transcript_16938:170-874(-)